MNPIKKIIIGPAKEPVELGLVKEHLRIDDSVTQDDFYISGLIKAARQYVEDFCGIQLITQTWDVYYQGWPFLEMELPVYPIQSVSSVSYTDSDGVDVEWSSDEWEVDIVSFSGRLVPRYGLSWPSDSLATLNPIAVRVVCGFGNNVQDIPMPIQQAIYILVADMYENREQILIGTIQAEFPAVSRLLGGYRMFRGF